MMEGSNHRSHSAQLGINKISKNIRKSPLHHHHHQQQQQPQPQQQAPQRPPPQVYNISKNDFRSLVQQLTGTPTRDPFPNPNPNPNPSPNASFSPYPPRPKPPSQRLQKIRPPPLAPIARPRSQIPIPIPIPIPNPNPSPRFNPSGNPNPYGMRPAESPVSAFMQYLESSMVSPDGSRRQPQGGPVVASPMGGAIPSPSAFLNLASPRSPYPLLSPGFQYLPPLSPNLSFSPLPSPGILGPGLGPQMPPSPGLLFPQSPTGFLPLMSPRWRNMWN